MMRSDLVSVNIPTFNSERTIGRTLESVMVQSHKHIELLVIDNGSVDKTKEICRSYGARVLSNSKSLLQSRCIGVKESRGDFVLFLDSDQVLTKECLQRSLALCSSSAYDYLFLEEYAYDTTSFLQKLYNADRIVVQSQESNGCQNSLRGVGLPRFFRTSILNQAIISIPRLVRESVVYRDHAVIYFEVEKISKKGGWLTDAIHHNENTSLRSLLKKHYRYAIDDSILFKSEEYRDLAKGKRNGRILYSKKVGLKYNLESQLLTIVKMLPYSAGWLLSTINSHF